MTRDELIVLLELHEPADDKERADLTLMLELAGTLAHPLSAGEPRGHFTASALVGDPGSRSATQPRKATTASAA